MRFCRSIYRVCRLLFKQKRKQVKNSLVDAPVAELIDRYPTTTDRIVELEDFYPLDNSDIVELVDAPPQIEEIQLSVTDKYLTVGQLFELVKWQISEPIDRKEPAIVEDIKHTIATTNSDRSGLRNISQLAQEDNYLTVGELLALVQWQTESDRRSDIAISNPSVHNSLLN